MITEIEPETMEKLMALSPVLHINEAEAKNYTGREHVEDAVKDIFAKSQNTVFVTLGRNGTMFYDGNEIRNVASFKTEVVDTVGAGDSHIGAVITGLSQGMEVKAAVRLANHVASAVVVHPDRLWITRNFKRFRRMGK